MRARGGAIDGEPRSRFCRSVLTKWSVELQGGAVRDEAGHVVPDGAGDVVIGLWLALQQRGVEVIHLT